MSWLAKAAQWMWDFIIGDDWITAAGIVAALGLTALIARSGTVAWWVMPPAVVGLLALSVHRASRYRRALSGSIHLGALQRPASWRVRRTPARRGRSTDVNARHKFATISFPQPFPRPCRRP